jgi:hypothetical protein
MEKLSKYQEKGIWMLLSNINNKEVVQCILETLGKENWTRSILIESVSYLTEEQEDLLESLGGGYTSEEIDEILHNDDINFEIAEKLKEQGVTHYLYENEEYLDEIREGKIICEGINLKEITKNMILE